MFAAPIVYLGENFRIIPRVVFFPFPLDSFLSLFVFIRALQLLFIFRNVIKKFFPESIFYRLLFDFSIRVFVSFVLVFFVFVFLEMWLKTKKFFPESIFNLLSAPFRFLNTYLCIFRCSNIVFEFSFYCYFFFLSFILCNWVKLVITFYLFGIFC